MPNREKYEKVLALVSKSNIRNIGRKGFIKDVLVQSLKSELEKPRLAVNTIDLILEKIQYGAGDRLAFKIQSILYGADIQLISARVDQGRQSKTDFWNRDVVMRPFRK